MNTSQSPAKPLTSVKDDTKKGTTSQSPAKSLTSVKDDMQDDDMQDDDMARLRRSDRIKIQTNKKTLPSVGQKKSRKRKCETEKTEDAAPTTLPAPETTPRPQSPPKHEPAATETSSPPIAPPKPQPAAAKNTSTPEKEPKPQPAAAKNTSPPKTVPKPPQAAAKNTSPPKTVPKPQPAETQTTSPPETEPKPQPAEAKTTSASKASFKPQHPPGYVKPAPASRKKYHNTPSPAKVNQNPDKIARPFAKDVHQFMINTSKFIKTITILFVAHTHFIVAFCFSDQITHLKTRLERLLVENQGSDTSAIKVIHTGVSDLASARFLIYSRAFYTCTSME